MIRRAVKVWVAAALGFAACGGSERAPAVPGAGDSTEGTPARRPEADPGAGTSTDTEWTRIKRPRSERTIDHWTLADESKYIGWACENVIAPDGTFRCPYLVKVGLSAASCVDSFGRLRAHAKTGSEIHTFRSIVAGLTVIDSCEDVRVLFQMQAKLQAMRDSEQLPPLTEEEFAQLWLSAIRKLTNRLCDCPYGDQACGRRQREAFSVEMSTVVLRLPALREGIKTTDPEQFAKDFMAGLVKRHVPVAELQSVQGKLEACAEHATGIQRKPDR